MTEANSALKTRQVIGVFPIRRNPIRWKIVLRIFNYIFLVRTFCYCNSEQSQHSQYAELGY